MNKVLSHWLIFSFGLYLGYRNDEIWLGFLLSTLGLITLQLKAWQFDMKEKWEASQNSGDKNK